MNYADRLRNIRRMNGHGFDHVQTSDPSGTMIRHLPIGDPRIDMQVMSEISSVSTHTVMNTFNDPALRDEDE